MTDRILFSLTLLCWSRACYIILLISTFSINSYKCKNLNNSQQVSATKLPQQWYLVDQYHFNGKNSKDATERLYNDQNWLIDDEPENLCLGEHIYQYSCHRKQNVQIKDDHLEIRADSNQHYGNSRFLFNSGKISSQKSWLYGKFEIRAILPEGKMLRSVFVLKPKISKYPGDWLDNGQINGLVYAQTGNSIIAGIHYRMAQGQSYNGRKLNTQQNITGEYHRYAIEWTNDTVRWLFDDEPYFVHQVSKPFDQEFYLVLQLGVGGPEFDTRYTVVQTNDANQWTNNRFIIDYVKVYQNKPPLSGELLPDLDSTRSGAPTARSTSVSSLFLLLLILVVYCLFL